MTAQPIPSKEELLEALRSSQDEVLVRLRVLSPEHFEAGRYESGWNGRQILAHIAAMEWTYPRLIDLARQTAADPGSTAPSSRTMQGGNDAYNAREVAKRAQASVAELLAEFERNRAATLAAVAGIDEHLLTCPIRSAGGTTGPLAVVLWWVAIDHVLGHTRDILGDPAGSG